MHIDSEAFESFLSSNFKAVCIFLCYNILVRDSVYTIMMYVLHSTSFLFQFHVSVFLPIKLFKNNVYIRLSNCGNKYLHLSSTLAIPRKGQTVRQS